jgi:hypothetical protein
MKWEWQDSATADRQEPTDVLVAKTDRLKEKITRLEQEMERLDGLEAQMLASPDRQISLTDPDARSMSSSGRGSDGEPILDERLPEMSDQGAMHTGQGTARHPMGA